MAMDTDRTEIGDGWVAIVNGLVTAVGEAGNEPEADRVTGATGCQAISSTGCARSIPSGRDWTRKPPMVSAGYIAPSSHQLLGTGLVLCGNSGVLGCRCHVTVRLLLIVRPCSLKPAAPCCGLVSEVDLPPCKLRFDTPVISCPIPALLFPWIFDILQTAFVDTEILRSGLAPCHCDCLSRLPRLPQIPNRPRFARGPGDRLSCLQSHQAAVQYIVQKYIY